MSLHRLHCESTTDAKAELMGLYSALFEGSPDCVELLDSEGRILAMNRNGLSLMEIEDFSQVANVPWATLWPEQGLPTVEAALQAARHGASSHFNAFCPTAKGTAKSWDVTVTPLVPADGPIQKILALSRELTTTELETHELEAREELFSLLLESSAEGIFGLSPDQSCTFINPAGAAILGYAPAELIGRQLHSLVHHHRTDGSAYPLSECHLIKAVNQGTRVQIEDEVFWRKDGKSVTVSYSVAPIIKDGVHTGSVVTFTDLTERKRAEKALYESQALVRLASDVAELGLWTLNVNTGVVTWENFRSYEILGLSPSHQPLDVTRFVVDFLHPGDVPAFEQAVRALSFHDTFYFQGRVRKQDGDVRWVEFFGRRQRKNSRSAPVVIGTMADITERKHAELALYESRERLEKIISQAATGVVQTDAEGRITLVNQKYCEMLRCTEADLIGTTILDVTAPDSIAQTLEKVGQLAAGGPGFNIDKQYLRKDGTTLWATSSVNALRSQDGQYQGLVAIVVDITERIEAEQALHRSENQLRSVLDSIPQKIFTASPSGDVNYLNPAWANFAGASFEKMLGWGWTDFIHPDDLDENMRLWQHAVKNSDSFQSTHRFRNAHGQYRWHLTRALPMRDETGHIKMWVGSSTDIQVVKLAEEALREQTEKLSLATEAAELGLFDHDIPTQTINWNGKMREFFGLDPQVKITRELLFELVHPDDRERMHDLISRLWTEPGEGRYRAEYRILTQQGKERWIAASGHVFYDALHRPVRLVGIAMDITERKENDKKKQDASQHDSLTGLPNRALLYEYCSHILAMSARHGGPVALLFIDLDRFKPINDLYGHDVGDKVLQQVAQRLLSCSRKEDIVSRLGGDEFIVVLPRITSRKDPTTIAANMLKAIGETIHIDTLQFQVSPSIGISLFPDHAQDLEQLIRCADTAMYVAKKDGRNTFKMYSSKLTGQANSLLQLEILLKHALDTDRLALYYQPILDVTNQALAGAEALIRVPSEDGRWLGATDFISVAETAGLMSRIGEWVIREACRQHRAWLDAGLPPIKIAVNVSPTQFRQAGFVSMVEEAIREFAIDPAYLQLEVTESTVMHNIPETIATLQRLQALGVEIALDDFGTGYSSLSHLSNLPLNKLKIDQSFIDNMGTSPNSRSIIEAIISLGQTLNLQVVGEGVESESAMKLLRDYGCHQAQGFLFAEPLPAHKFVSWYRQHQVH